MEQVASPPPLVGPAHVTHRVIVNVELSSESTGSWLMGNGGVRIKPDTFSVEFLNGRLFRCSVLGKRVRQDGHEYLDGSRDERSFMHFVFVGPGNYRVKQRELSPRAPEWVADLVHQFTPDITLRALTNGGAE